jgi:GMP synthase-like glutamine amidotransferase
MDEHPDIGRAGLILQHEDAAPPALFADWCESRGISYEVLRVWEDGLPDDPRDHPWICSLGSDHSPGGTDAPAWVDEEVRFLRRALDADVPVLGLCFGGQALAAAAGAQIAPADPPEVGWFEIETDSPDEIPSGPWAYFHYDQFAPPPGAVEIARSPAGTAAFRLGRHLGLQFHPEATPAILDGWCASEEERLVALGISPSAVAVAGREGGRAAEDAAGALFDRWWAGLGID